MSVAVDGVAGLSMRPGTVAWWRQATADLQTVRESQMIARHYAALWFSQQPVAKGLQAQFVESADHFASRTHDLELLGQVIQAPVSVQRDLVLLNPASHQLMWLMMFSQEIMSCRRRGEGHVVTQSAPRSTVDAALMDVAEALRGRVGASRIVLFGSRTS